MDPRRTAGHPARDGVPWGGNRTTVGAGVVSELHDRRNWGRHALGLGRVIGTGGSHRGRTMGIEFGQLGIVPRRPTVLRSNRSVLLYASVRLCTPPYRPPTGVRVADRTSADPDTLDCAPRNPQDPGISRQRRSIPVPPLPSLALSEHLGAWADGTDGNLSEHENHVKPHHSSIGAGLSRLTP